MAGRAREAARETREEMRAVAGAKPRDPECLSAACLWLYEARGCAMRREKTQSVGDPMGGAGWGTVRAEDR